MKILAIDPGTHCGYALSPFESGVWNLSVGRHEGGGMRFVKLRSYLVKASEGVELLVYEEVRGHKGTDAAQVYGGIVAIIQEHCEQLGIPYQGVPVGTIKKFGRPPPRSVSTSMEIASNPIIAAELTFEVISRPY